MIIEEFFAQLKNIRPQFASKLFYATQVVCRMQHVQRRDSGEPYLEHVFDVAYQLYRMGLPEDVVIAGELHDLVEDTRIRVDQIEQSFGQHIALLVSSVSKKPRSDFATKEERFTEAHERWMTYCAIDWCAIFLKLADRLHNLVTLHGLFKDPSKQQRVAQETLDFYLPFIEKQARELVPREFHYWLDYYRTQMRHYALAHLEGSQFNHHPD